MDTFRSMTFLRGVLLIDALSSALVGIVSLAFSELLASLLGLPAQLLMVSAWVLLPFAAFVAYLASQPEPPRSAVWAVIALNASWVLGCVALQLSGDVVLNSLGYAFIVVQAVVVGAFAELQYIGLRRRQALTA